MNPEVPNQQQAQEAARQAIAEIRASYQARFANIDQPGRSENERIQLRAQLAREAQAEIGTRIREQIRDAGQPGTPEESQTRARSAKRIFLEVKELNNEGVDVVNKKSQAIVDKIVEKIKTGEITDQGVLDIERNIGTQLIEGVVFSQPGEQASSFEEGLRTLLQVNPQAANPIIGNIAANPETYGTTRENLIEKLGVATPESNSDLPEERATEQTPNQEPTLLQEPISSNAFEGDFMQYYRSRFTQEQINLISTFYSPEAFVSYMEQLSNETSDGKNNPLAVQQEKQAIEKKIRDYYEKKGEPKTSTELREEVDKHWGEKVSREFNWRVSDVINQLFLELQQKSPHKFYEEIMQEDIFQGPAMIQKRIQAAINSLMTKVDQIEKGNSGLAKRMKDLKLYRISAKGGSFIEERGEGPDSINKNLYPRLNPLPFGEPVSLSEFVQTVYMTIDQTIHKAEYFHNARAIFGHPAGEKGFYSQLGEYAESLKGADIDEIMLLPDGKYVMQAFQLYEKMLEEDFASLDWKHRPDQFTNQLERVNSKLELEVLDQLKAFYPELTRERVKNIVNSAVGIARGVFLTDPEKSAYADPVDSEGGGMVASYSTNDAASLNVFNPLHNALRWQGEHNWNMMYFMPVEGQKGPWNHKEAWSNMAKYMDSFLVGRGRREEGKDKLPKVFADAMMDINNVGGPNKRKGWRLKYSLDAHFEYDDNTINALKTFKAMEAIGYEAIFNFVNEKQLGKDLMKATKNGRDLKERKDMFRYIFKRYFYKGDQKNFRESYLDDYLSKLQKKGEEQALKQLKEKGSPSIVGSWEEQVAYETSRLFMENTLAHYVAARMPSKFLRIDRNRFTEDGVSRWEQVWREFKKKGWERGKFDQTMKNLTMAEMLLRRQISEQIREQISLDKDWKLHMIDSITDLPFRLDEAKIQELLGKNSKGGKFKEQSDIDKVKELWAHINEKTINNEFLDSKGAKQIRDYTFTFGLEDTDISLIPYRGTGPRMVARAIKDTASIEQTVTPWLLNMPMIMNEVAVNGKHDFSEIITYMRKAQKAIFDVHGTDAAQKFVYDVAGTVINYYKKDGMAKPLFGLFGIGKINSIAGEYAGRSTAVWEWDSRDIDRFATALESYRLLPKNAYDLNKTIRSKFVKGKLIKGEFIGGQLEDRWIKLPFLKNPVKFGKKRHIDWEWNGTRLRKDHGADTQAITSDWISQLLPIAIVFILWKYLKDSLDEASGKKK